MGGDGTARRVLMAWAGSEYGESLRPHVFSAAGEGRSRCASDRRTFPERRRRKACIGAWGLQRFIGGIDRMALQSRHFPQQAFPVRLPATGGSIRYWSILFLLPMRSRGVSRRSITKEDSLSGLSSSCVAGGMRRDRGRRTSGFAGAGQSGVRRNSGEGEICGAQACFGVLRLSAGAAETAGAFSVAANQAFFASFSSSTFRRASALALSFFSLAR